MNIQLYNCAEETVQNSIINTYPEFFNADPSKLLDMLEVLVTMKSNPIVHRISFSSIAQGDSEPVKDYLIRLKSGARDCNFICPNCHHDLSSIYVKDHFWTVSSAQLYSWMFICVLLPSTVLLFILHMGCGADGWKKTVGGNWKLPDLTSSFFHANVASIFYALNSQSLISRQVKTKFSDIAKGLIT